MPRVTSTPPGLTACQALYRELACCHVTRLLFLPDGEQTMSPCSLHLSALQKGWEVLATKLLPSHVPQLQGTRHL